MRSQSLFDALSIVATLGALATATLGLGCAASARVSASAHAEPPLVFVGEPTLVAVGSGVWVVRDSDRAAYYVDDTYWVVRDGTWYRAPSYDGEWVVVEAVAVPPSIVTRDHATFVHYAGDPGAETRPAPRGAMASHDGPGQRDSHAGGNPHGGPPGHDEMPGVGNQRKAEGEQPGRAPGGEPPGKHDAPPAAADAPGHAEPPGLAKKAEAPAPRASSAVPHGNGKKAEKRDTPKKK